MKNGLEKLYPYYCPHSKIVENSLGDVGLCNGGKGIILKRPVGTLRDGDVCFITQFQWESPHVIPESEIDCSKLRECKYYRESIKNKKK